MSNDNGEDLFASYQRDAVADMARIREETVPTLRRCGHNYAAVLVEEQVADLERLFEQSIVPHNGRPNWDLVAKFADQMVELHRGAGDALRGAD